MNNYLRTVFLLFTVAFVSTSAKTILVFGGNGNIGSEVVTQLLLDNHKLVLVNRGTWYWDSKDRIFPKVTFFKCDRLQGCDDDEDACNALEKCEDFMDYIKTAKFDAVIDFSAYDSKVLENAVRVLREKVGIYMYISSDSVYEVSRPSSHGGPSRETDAIRPDDEERERLNQADSYGDEKLTGEEVLIDLSSKEGGPPYLIFRLPDVMGPRDTTNRWWVYQLWVKYYPQIKRPIPIDVDQNDTSMVYTMDVGMAVRLALQRGQAVANQTYNLGSSENFNLQVLIQKIAKALKVPPPQIHEQHSAEITGPILWPSVSRGPVDIRKVRSQLGFVPSPWDFVVGTTVRFYEGALGKFHWERERMIEYMLEHVVPEENHEAFIAAVQRDVEKLQENVEEQNSKKTESAKTKKDEL